MKPTMICVRVSTIDPIYTCKLRSSVWSETVSCAIKNVDFDEHLQYFRSETVFSDKLLVCLHIIVVFR